MANFQMFDVKDEYMNTPSLKIFDVLVSIENTKALINLLCMMMEDNNMIANIDDCISALHIVRDKMTNQIEVLKSIEDGV